MDINNLSLEEKIGQRFIIGVNNENTKCIINLIKNCMIGGVILYKKNYHSYDEMINLIKSFKEANKDNKLPLFIAIDQECGRVNRLPNEIHNLKNITDVSKTDKLLVEDYARLIANVLCKSGINMNFAPVLDVYQKDTSKALYKRCFYGNKDMVSDSARMYLKGIDNMIIPVIKHYPGHGATKRDSHFLVPYIFNYKDILDNHMAPFHKLDDVPAIMVGHLIIRRLTGLLPASISNKFINHNIRTYYDGLVITDEINMIRKWPVYNLIYLDKALKANSDIILLKIKNYKEGYRIIERYKKILKNTDNLDESVKRLIKVKKKYQINDNTNYHGIDIAKINDEIDALNAKIS